MSITITQGAVLTIFMSQKETVSLLGHYITTTVFMTGQIYLTVSNHSKWRQKGVLVYFNVICALFWLMCNISAFNVILLLPVIVHGPIGQHAYTTLYRHFSLAWKRCLSLVPSGPKCISVESDRLNKQTNKQCGEWGILISVFWCSHNCVCWNSINYGYHYFFIVIIHGLLWK